MILLLASLHLPHFIAYYLPYMYTSQINLEVEQEVLPRLMLSPCFEVQKHFSHPNVWIGGVKAQLDHLPRERMKLVASTLHKSLKVIWYEFPSRQVIATMSPFALPTIHPFTWNCIFNTFDKSLLTESNLACNLRTWSTFVMQILVVLPLIST